MMGIRHLSFNYTGCFLLGVFISFCCVFFIVIIVKWIITWLVVLLCRAISCNIIVVIVKRVVTFAGLRGFCTWIGFVIFLYIFVIVLIERIVRLWFSIFLLIYIVVSLKTRIVFGISLINSWGFRRWFHITRYKNIFLLVFIFLRGIFPIYACIRRSRPNVLLANCFAPVNFTWTAGRRIRRQIGRGSFIFPLLIVRKRVAPFLGVHGGGHLAVSTAIIVFYSSIILFCGFLCGGNHHLWWDG